MSPAGAVPAALDLTEKQWSDQLVGTAGNPGLARTLGWNTCYHTMRAKGSASGFPDWVLVRERVIFLELKREDGIVTATQREWIQKLYEAAAEVYVVRPRHLEEIAKVLARRSPPEPILWPGGTLPVLLSAELESVLGS